MVLRLYVEKKRAFAQEARAVASDIRNVLGIAALQGVRLLNRYDVEGMDEALFDACRETVFCEPQTDVSYASLPESPGSRVFAVEYLPGQFDQRADAAANCIALISGGPRPNVRTARVYLLAGALTDDDFAAVRKYLVNPVEAREAQLAPYESLEADYPEPARVERIDGFLAMDGAGLEGLLSELGLAMDLDDLRLCQSHFAREGRDPTLTEIRVLDTYWSDHCRHTTFLTAIEEIAFHGSREQAAYERYLGLRNELGITKPVTLMDMATIGAKYLKRKGLLERLDASPEINACTVEIDVDVDGRSEPWLLLFKNETHNHPTEIEPFGGAATCIGGAIRDPLSGRGYVYQAMRVTGAADPRRPLSETLPGKLSQRKLVTTAAAGFSSYGNQIGLATGLVHELYHEGYAAKRMEVGAVIAAVPKDHVRREEPLPGDVVILVGGRTGRDGCGGATGSSKAHTESSLEQCGAEVQKGNAPEERKLQRLFRNPEATLLIKRCNDFGAGGVSVAVGELADGLNVNLDLVPRKYEGLDGTELAISESQERMAVVVEASDAGRFMELAAAENLMATVIARVTGDARLSMDWRGERIVDIPRSFIATNGAPKRASAVVEEASAYRAPVPDGFADGMASLVRDLNACSQRGLSERFDSTVGANTVLMPFGGSRQRTPGQAMVAKLPVLNGDTETCSFMAWGFDPYVSSASPYMGAYTAVVWSIARLMAAGAPLDGCYLSFQEYFPKPGDTPERWGLPAAALLGALDAEVDLGIAAIGGKDSMSGSFGELSVPPTLISFAVSTGSLKGVVSPEFKQAGSRVVLIAPERDDSGLPVAQSVREAFRLVRGLNEKGLLKAAYAPGRFGVAQAAFHMALGNGLGFRFNDEVELSDLFSPAFGAIVAEVADGCDEGVELGRVTAEAVLAHRNERLSVAALEGEYDAVLEEIFPNHPAAHDASDAIRFTSDAKPQVKPRLQCARPRVLIPVFPGTNCEYESSKAAERAGCNADVFIVNTLTPDSTRESIAAFARALSGSQILFIPGGFSNGDEPDGSGKYITSFLRNPAISDGIASLLERRDGLILGVCNGFQALIKLGLVPYGRICPPDAQAPTLTFNAIARHQSRLVRTRIASRLSPWLMLADAEAVYTIPVSHGEGRFIADEATIHALAKAGQIATQYCDAEGAVSMDIGVNPNGSAHAIEGITSIDGRVFGKMGHSERIGAGLYKNVPGTTDMRLFEAAALYFA